MEHISVINTTAHVAEKKAILTPQWNCSSDLLFVAFIIIIIQNGLPLCLLNYSAFAQNPVHL